MKDVLKKPLPIWGILVLALVALPVIFFLVIVACNIEGVTDSAACLLLSPFITVMFFAPVCQALSVLFIYRIIRVIQKKNVTSSIPGRWVFFLALILFGLLSYAKFHESTADTYRNGVDMKHQELVHSLQSFEDCATSEVENIHNRRSITAETLSDGSINMYCGFKQYGYDLFSKHMTYLDCLDEPAHTIYYGEHTGAVSVKKYCEFVLEGYAMRTFTVISLQEHPTEYKEWLASIQSERQKNSETKPLTQQEKAERDALVEELETIRSQY